MSAYHIATDAEKKELGYCQEYDLLVGPHGFECMLGEPEDCKWYRDGAPVVAELNRLNDLMMALADQIIAAGV
jgi:hypothetical protein